MKYLHYRLANLRSENNMTQAELGRKIGVSRQTIWHFENNQRTPSLNRILQYSEIFNVTTDWILKGDKNGMD